MSGAVLAGRTTRPHVLGDRTAQADAGGASAAGPSLRRASRTRSPRGIPRRGGREPGDGRTGGRGGGRRGAVCRCGGLRTDPGPRAARARHDPGDGVEPDGARGPCAARAAASRAAERPGRRLAHRRVGRVGGMAGGGDRPPAFAQHLVGQVAARARACAACADPGARQAWGAFGHRGVKTALRAGPAQQTDLRATFRSHLRQRSHRAPGADAGDRPAARWSATARARAARPGAVPAGRRGRRKSRWSRGPPGAGPPEPGPPDREGAHGPAAQGQGRSTRAHRAGHDRSLSVRMGGRRRCWNEGHAPRSFSSNRRG